MADIILGNDAQTGKPIMLKEKDFALGGYSIGVRRVGKSFLLEQLILQSINNRRGVCVIDPHGDLIENVIGRVPEDRLEDVLYLDPLDHKYPFPLNSYHCEDKNNPKLLQYTVDSVMHLFEKLFPSETTQPMVEDVLRVCAHTIIANDMTMVEIPRLILDRAFRNHLLRNVTNYDVQAFWESFDNLKPDEQERQAGIVARRVRKFTTNEIIKYIVGQSEKTLNFRSILDDWKNPKIVLVRLYADMPELTSLIGSVIVGQLLQAALSRSTTDKRPEFHLYCDEYSRFATSDFSTIISEAGKYNIIPFIAHQSRGQISEENQDSAMQLGLIVCFRVIPRDDNDMAGCFDCTPVNAPIPMVIPGNVLDYLKTHQSQNVQDLWKYYVRDWQELVKKDETIHYQHRKGLYRNSEGKVVNEAFAEYDFELSGAIPIERKVTVLPKHDFRTGLGIVEYNPQDIRIAMFELEELLRYAMKGGGIQYYQIKSFLDPWDKTSELIREYDIVWWGTPHVAKIMTTLATYYEWRFYTKWHYGAYQFATDYPNATPQELDEWFAKIPQYELEEMGYESVNAQPFLEYLARAVKALYKAPILLPAVPILPPQQNFTDRRNQIANELSSLNQRIARVRVNRRHEGITEHIIETITPRHQPNYQNEHIQKKNQIVQNMHSIFKTRAQVEEEIRCRQESYNQPATKRKHTL
ncbi:MAG TPA: hypothetical protein VEL49_03825 [Ktedonobacteraceae bacterium]|nr:hypothetical protein [Ktedonobacteraceae bacterium]